MISHLFNLGSHTANYYQFDRSTENETDSWIFPLIKFLIIFIINVIYVNSVQSLAHNVHYNRPQRSWAKVIFLHVSVILLTGEVSPNFWGGSKFSGGSPILGGCLQFFGGGRCL